MSMIILKMIEENNTSNKFSNAENLNCKEKHENAENLNKSFLKISKIERNHENQVKRL